MGNRDCWTTLTLSAKQDEVASFLADRRDEYPFLYEALEAPDWGGWYQYEYHAELRRVSRRFPDVVFTLDTESHADGTAAFWRIVAKAGWLEQHNAEIVYPPFDEAGRPPENASLAITVEIDREYVVRQHLSPDYGWRFDPEASLAAFARELAGEVRDAFPGSSVEIHYVEPDSTGRVVRVRERAGAASEDQLHLQVASLFSGVLYGDAKREWKVVVEYPSWHERAKHAS